jgi:hypothetical protein
MDAAEGSAEEAELKALVGVIEAYEEKRWPLDVVPGRAVEAV